MSAPAHIHVDGAYEPDAKIRISQPKATGVGNSFLFGQTLVWDETDDQWEKAASGSTGRFGFCTNPELLTHTTNELTGDETFTRGVGESATACSVLVEGTVEKKAEGAIAGGAYVKVATTDPNKLMEWVSGVDAIGLVVATYVINLKQKHEANEPIPDAADGDSIKVEKREANT